MKNTCSKLEQILKEIPERLASISEEESAVRPSPEKWSKKELLGHLIDSAANNHQRFVRLQLENDLSLPGYRQNEWVAVQRYQQIPWNEIIGLWKAYNTHLLHVIRVMDQSKITNKASIGGHAAVTLGFIADDYVVHMEHHLAQVFSGNPAPADIKK